MRRLSTALLVLLALLAIARGAAGESKPNFVKDVSGTEDLTASDTIYLPTDEGIDIRDRESFSIQFYLTEETGSDPNATVYVEVSNDGVMWTRYTQNVFYRADAAASASITITAETTQYYASVHPGPCQKLRFPVAENAGDDDVSITYAIAFQ